jgi:hypothetical protein
MSQRFNWVWLAAGLFYFATKPIRWVSGKIQDARSRSKERDDG